MSDQLTMRDAMLKIAAAVAEDMPVPVGYRFADQFLWVDVDSIDAGLKWLSWFGGDAATAYVREYDQDGRARRLLAYDPFDAWHGWSVSLIVIEPTPARVAKQAPAPTAVS